MKESDPYPMSTLARLSFWVPAARMDEFETAYESRLVPILKGHGLAESTEQGRPTAEGILSRLFSVDSPAAVVEKEKALQEDSAWREALQDLGATLGAAAPDGSLRWRFWFYRAPAGPGKSVPVGPGKGHWRTFDVTDGLVDMFIFSIFQDREGYLWFGSFSGVGRYDGQQFKSFAIKDGLADNSVSSIAQDQEGNLWFGTPRGGVGRYNGREFTTFTAQAGLAGNSIWSICQDCDGNLWFATGQAERGVRRYDGKHFTSFTVEDGLAHDNVEVIYSDRQGNLWFGTAGGANRYDGQEFKHFKVKDGLAANYVRSIYQDREGDLATTPSRSRPWTGI